MFRWLLIILSASSIIVLTPIECSDGLLRSPPAWLEGLVAEAAEIDEPVPCTRGAAQVPLYCLPFAEELIYWANERNLDPALVWAVAMAESSLRPEAVRREPRIKDASYGLMQILYSTAKEVGYEGEPSGLLEVGTNLQYGTAYLRQLLDRFGDTRLALAAYNAGPTRVSRLRARYGPTYEHIRLHLPSKTRAYVQRVLDWYRHFEILEGSGA